MKFVRLAWVWCVGLSLLVIAVHGLATSAEIRDIAAGQVDATLRGSRAEDFMGYVVKGGDVNGDGTHDLIIGATGVDAGGTSNVGAVYVVPGGSRLTGTYGITETAVVTLLGRLEENGFAGQIVAAGSVNGDEYADMLIASRWSDVISGSDVLTNAGRVYLVYGRDDLSGTLNLETAADTQFLGAGVDDFTGQGLHIADLNDDGHSDLIIGASRWQTYTGKVYVVWGPGPFMPEVRLEAEAGVTLLGPAPNNSFGYAPTTGDVNGDGFPDLILAAGSSKSIYVVYGPVSLSGTVPVSAAADLTLVGGAAVDAAWGFTLSSADLNGDGYDEIATTAQNADYAGTNAGAVFVIWGAADLTGTVPISETAVTLITGESPFDALGRFQLVTTDVIGDPLPDVVVGASYADFGGARMDAGKAYVVAGSSSFVTGTVPVTAVADIAVWGAANEGNLGQSVAGIDVDGNQATDLVVTAHAAQIDNKDSVGELYVWYNDPPPVTTLYLPVIMR